MVDWTGAAAIIRSAGFSRLKSWRTRLAVMPVEASGRTARASLARFYGGGVFARVGAAGGSALNRNNVRRFPAFETPEANLSSGFEEKRSNRKWFVGFLIFGNVERHFPHRRQRRINGTSKYPVRFPTDGRVFPTTSQIVRTDGLVGLLASNIVFVVREKSIDFFVKDVIFAVQNVFHDGKSDADVDFLLLRLFTASFASFVSVNRQVENLRVESIFRRTVI